MRVRTRGFSPRVLLTRWRKLVRSRPRCTRKESNTDGANPSVASLDRWVCNVPLSEHQSSALWACIVPLRNTRPREYDAGPSPRFLASWPLRSLAYNRKITAPTAPEGAGARSCFCLTRGAIDPQNYGNSIQLTRLEAVASPLARRAVSDILPVPQGQT